MKFPIPATTQIKRATDGSGVDEYESLLKNVTVDILGGTPVASRRYGARMWHADNDASSIANAVGRGLFFGNQITSGPGTLYKTIINLVYVGGVAKGTFTVNADQDTLKVHGTTLLDATYDAAIVDSASGELMVINAAAGVLVGAAPVGLEAGVVNLNGRIYVAKAGAIYNSDLNSPTTGYTDFVSAERVGDDIACLERHHDHIVAFGYQSIEFFYDSGTSPGSPLQRREDVQYNVGLLHSNSLSREDDVIYFLGGKDGRVTGLYKLENFQIERITDSRTIRWFNRSNQIFPNLSLPMFVVTAFLHEGKTLIAITKYDLDGGVSEPSLGDDVQTMVFETDGRAYVWDLDGVSETTNFQLIGSDGDVHQLSNGDEFAFDLTDASPDTYKDSLTFPATTQTAFTSTIEFNDFDGDDTAWKFCKSVEPYGEYETGCAFNLSWSDEGGAYNTPRGLTKENRQRAISCGRFSRRRFKLTTTDDSDVIDEYMNLEGLKANIDLGSY